MQHVIEVDDGDAPVLTESGSAGLIGHGLLVDRPLATYVEPTETPAYVVRNKKRGVTIERTDDARTADEGTEVGTETALTPDSDHSAAVLVTDVRVLFAIGRADGDRTRSVSLSEVIDARTEDGLLGGTLILDTVDGRRVRFPSRGDLSEVREYVDTAAGVWARAGRHLDTAEEALETARTAFEADDGNAALSAVDDSRAALERAREAAASLSGASAAVSERAEAFRSQLAEWERRAHVKLAEQAYERGHGRHEDGEYEAAFDCFDRADERYAAALVVDAERPSDDLVKGRRKALAAARDDLSRAPLKRAEHAVEMASDANDLETEVEWWERALERYETMRSLDWGRDEQRFAGDRDAVHTQLATVTERLVEARCDRAQQTLDATADAPAATAAAADRAASALDEAREVARERVPSALETVDELQARLADCRSAQPEDTEATSAPETVAVTSDADDDESTVTGSAADVTPDESTADDRSPDDTETAASADCSSPGGSDGTSTDAESASAEADDQGDWVFVDDGMDGDWLSATRSAETQVAHGGAEWTVDHLSDIESGQFRSLVADLFEATGWETETHGAGMIEFDVRATALGPVPVVAGIVTVPANQMEAVDTTTVERLTAVERRTGLDAVVIAVGAHLRDPVRDRLDGGGFHVLDPATLVDKLDRNEVSNPRSDYAES